MARPRKHADTERHHIRPQAMPKSKKAATARSTIGFQPIHGMVLSVVIGILAFGGYFYYRKMLENRIRTPLDVPRAVSNHVPERYWGSYRPGMYFGMKTRSMQSPVMGLMWLSQKMVGNQIQVRHECEMGDYSQRYSWLEHDGINYGLQEIYDSDVVITTSFVKTPGGLHGGDWTARLSVKPLEKIHTVPSMSLFFYVALDRDGSLELVTNGNTIETISGESQATGSFQMTFVQNGTHKLTMNYLSTVVQNLAALKETLAHTLAYISTGKQSAKHIGLIGERFPQNINLKSPNFIVHQVTGVPPFDLEVIYESSSFLNRPTTLSGAAYNKELSALRNNFDKRFEEAFHLPKNISTEEIRFAKAAFSNLIGGIGYFHGFSFVQSEFNERPVPYFEAPLYSAVPSRSFFPRGFLWDEGFHNLLLLRWDTNIVKDIIAHWLDLINIEGWIPREQILDDEARTRVPAEFVVQRNTNANPPTLFLPLRAMLKGMRTKGSPSTSDTDFLSRIFPRLKSWFHWFNTTQVGRLPGTYRWRGRNGTNLEELNPITLTSGFDDYPRASHPTDDERHVDLRCWIAFAAGVMADIAKAIGEQWEDYAATQAYLSDNSLLDSLHWSPVLQAYADYGLHTDKVKLEKRKSKPSQPGKPAPNNVALRVFYEEPKLQHVNAFGYVSLFPFLLQIVDPSSDKLGKILGDLERRDLLWTDYGLRSLATTSPLYNKPNTLSSPPYWRGAIWINMNYLAVEALRHYGEVDGPYRELAKTLFQKLRALIIKNMYIQYETTGYLWEQYNDKIGSGQRAHPFTGWSALVALMMSEN